MLNWPIEKSKLWTLSWGNYYLSPKYKNNKVIHNHGFGWLITTIDKQRFCWNHIRATWITSPHNNTYNVGPAITIILVGPFPRGETFLIVDGQLAVPCFCLVAIGKQELWEKPPKKIIWKVKNRVFIGKTSSPNIFSKV